MKRFSLKSAISGMALTLTSVIAFSSHSFADNKTYTFGIVPQQSATKLAEVWLPLLKEIEAKTGYSIRFATAKDIPTFEACLAQQAYDFAYMNPYHYIVFNKLSGYIAFAKAKDKALKGILVTRKGSGIQTIEDLEGETIAFPSPAAFGASVMPRAELKQKGVNFNAKYVNSHDSVYRAVIAGLYNAGGGVMRTYNNLSEEMKNQLHIFYETKQYTPHAFAALSTLPSKVVNDILNAMLSINNPNIYKEISPKGFEEAIDINWNDVRELNLDRSHTQIKADGGAQCHSD
jgi:phosphonate transport system substrate-binding protein